MTGTKPREESSSALDDIVDELAGVPQENGTIEEFTHDGSTLVTETGGEGDRTFVLVHGIGMGRRVFADVAERLVSDSRVIAVDLPGYGEAPEPERTPTIERMADTLAALIRERGLDKPVLIGHSMGTQVVSEVAARHPSLTERIVLVGPTVEVGARSPLRQLWRLGRDLITESPKVLLLGAREYLRAGPYLRRKMHAMLAHEPEKTYPSIRARALVLRGATDPVCPEPWCRWVAEQIPDAAFTQIDEHGHETLIDDAGPAVERIRAWLDE